MGHRGDLVRALRAGIDAGLATSPVSACPYPRGDLRRSAWVRGYAKARALPVATDSGD
ncbi:Rmf/CrpP fold protein [Streptomyces sp. NPDC059814]|uniref:Rmf/CrpP fold protein n=1 Tax=Streptomyces sp. NPDC059814 TaxID=3346959 RepID=UPI00364E5F96